MDWQELVALMIVATTVIVFGWRGFQSRRRGQHFKSRCGCDEAAGPSKPPGTILRGRKNQRPQLIVKAK
jgi:hypothetical protein